MVKNSRTPILFAGALLVGVAAGAIGMMSMRGGDGPYASTPGQATHAMGAAPTSTAFVMAVAGNCDMAPVLPHAGSGDGQESLQAKPDAANAGEVASLILRGKEAAAAGRQHDAEVGFLNACRSAAALTDGDPIPLADSMYQLGRLYANAAALGSPQAKPLFQRAERLYSASLEAYRARYGDNGEKTHYAQQGLLTVQQATGGKAPVAIAKAAPPLTAASSAPAPVAPLDAAATSGSAPVAASGLPSPAASAGLTATLPTPEPAKLAKASTDADKAAAVPHPKPRSTLPRSTRDEPEGTDFSSMQEAARERPDNLPAPIIDTQPRSRSVQERTTPDTTTAAVEEPRPRTSSRRSAQRDDAAAYGSDAVADQPLPRRARAADAGEEISLPPATASGSTGVPGGDGGSQ